MIKGKEGKISISKFFGHNSLMVCSECKELVEVPKGTQPYFKCKDHQECCLK